MSALNRPGLKKQWGESQSYQQAQKYQVDQTQNPSQTYMQAQAYPRGDAQLQGYQEQQAVQKEYLQGNAQVQVSQEPIYQRLRIQEYQQPYQASSYTAQNYQQPYQSSSYTAQNYQQPYQASSYTAQNYQQPYQRSINQGLNSQTWQTTGVESGRLPSWKSSYTPISGQGNCYNKCRPNCNENVFGGSCQQACKTACNISPSCGTKSNVQYAGKTMLCGRMGYNSQQVINGYSATAPLIAY